MSWIHLAQNRVRWQIFVMVNYGVLCKLQDPSSMWNSYSMRGYHLDWCTVVLYLIITANTKISPHTYIHFHELSVRVFYSLSRCISVVLLHWFFLFLKIFIITNTCSLSQCLQLCIRLSCGHFASRSYADATKSMQQTWQANSYSHTEHILLM